MQHWIWTDSKTTMNIKEKWYLVYSWKVEVFPKTWTVFWELSKFTITVKIYKSVSSINLIFYLMYIRRTLSVGLKEMMRYLY